MEGRRKRSMERMTDWQVRNSRKISKKYLEGKQAGNSRKDTKKKLPKVWKEEKNKYF